MEKLILIHLAFFWIYIYFIKQLKIYFSLTSIKKTHLHPRRVQENVYTMKNKSPRLRKSII